MREFRNEIDETTSSKPGTMGKKDIPEGLRIVSFSFSIRKTN